MNCSASTIALLHELVYVSSTKGGTGNIKKWTFCHFPADISSFSPLLIALHSFYRWISCDLDPLTSIFCYRKMKVVTFIHDYIVTKNLHEDTLQEYPNPNHFYNLHIKYFYTNSFWVIACLILVVSNLSNATIEHRLSWASSAWKVYICEILYHVS